MPVINTEKLLPCGSVVLLDGAEKPLLIIGIMPVDQETNDEHDYLGVPYPEGYISRDYMYMFDNEDIKETQFLGYVDLTLQTYRGALSQMEIDTDFGENE